MLSRIFALLIPVAVAWPLHSCTSATDKLDDEYKIGRPPEFYSAAYLWRAGDTNSVVAVAQRGMTLQRFTLDPFAHVSSLPLALPYEKQGVASSYDGAYYLTLSETEYAVLKADGTSTKNPIELLGKIDAVAFDPVNHYAVVSDVNKTMALLVLSPAGDVLASWKVGGRMPAEAQDIKSGAILLDGRLLLTLTSSVAIVDFKASVEANEWRYTTLPVDAATDMKWVATVPGQADVVMILDANRILTLDVNTGTIVAQQDVSSQRVVDYSRDYVPHVITNDGTDFEQHGVYYAGPAGTLATASLRGMDRTIRRTMLDPEGQLTVVYAPAGDWGEEGPVYADQEVYRFRLSDNAGLDKSKVPEAVSLAVTPSHLFLHFPSALGKAVRRSYGNDPQDQVVQGYNLPILRTAQD